MANKEENKRSIQKLKKSAKAKQWAVESLIVITTVW
jgi:hypothetical protein